MVQFSTLYSESVAQQTDLNYSGLNLDYGGHAAVNVRTVLLHLYVILYYML